MNENAERSAEAEFGQKDNATTWSPRLVRGGAERIKMDPSDTQTDLVSTTMGHDDQDIDNDNAVPAISEGMTGMIGTTLGRLGPTNRRIMVIGAGGSAMLVIGAIQLVGRRRAISDR